MKKIKQKTIKQKLNLPLVLDFGDYHGIEDCERTLNSVSSHKVESEQVAFDGRYYGCFWTGKKPSNSEIKKLCIDAGWATARR